jgi:hypothetical protein
MRPAPVRFADDAGLDKRQLLIRLFEKRAERHAKYPGEQTQIQD